VVDRVGARQQLPEPVKQVFEPQPGAYALVEGVFVQDHALVESSVWSVWR
jgi:hypothetical protein